MFDAKRHRKAGPGSVAMCSASGRSSTAAGNRDCRIGVARGGRQSGTLGGGDHHRLFDRSLGATTSGATAAISAVSATGAARGGQRFRRRDSRFGRSGRRQRGQFRRRQRGGGGGGGSSVAVTSTICDDDRIGRGGGRGGAWRTRPGPPCAGQEAVAREPPETATSATITPGGRRSFIASSHAA